MRIRALNHSTYQHQYHIVWGTKYRRKYLKPYVKQEFLSCLYACMEKYPTLYLHACNVDQDHVHLQLEIAPDTRVATAIQHLKALTSIHLKHQFKFIRDMYIDGGIWSVGYFSSTIGLNEAQIKHYIEWQGKKDTPSEWQPLEFP